MDRQRPVDPQFESLSRQAARANRTVRVRNAQFLIVLAFVAIFGAGAVSAIVATRLGDGGRHGDGPGPGGPGLFGRPGGGGGGGGGPGRDGKGPGGWLAAELQLSPDQEARMKDIWSGVREQMQSLSRDKRRELARQRDTQIRALLSESQRADYDRILADYEKKQEELRDAGERAVREAERRTREVLSDAQRLKYDQLLKQRQQDREKDRERDRDKDRGPGGPPSPSSPPSPALPPLPPPGPDRP